jgi:hypothetical protein
MGQAQRKDHQQKDPSQWKELAERSQSCKVNMGWHKHHQEGSKRKKVAKARKSERKSPCNDLQSERGFRSMEVFAHENELRN